jgi:hypothetical protein
MKHCGMLSPKPKLRDLTILKINPGPLDPDSTKSTNELKEMIPFLRFKPVSKGSSSIILHL